MPTRIFCISRNQLRLLDGSGISVQTTAALILEDWLCWPGYGHATDIKQIAFQCNQDGGLFSSGRPAALFVTATCNARVYLGDLGVFRERVERMDSKFLSCSLGARDIALIQSGFQKGLGSFMSVRHYGGGRGKAPQSGIKGAETSSIIISF